MRLIIGLLLLALSNFAHSAHLEEVILPFVEMKDLTLRDALTEIQSLIDRNSTTKITIKFIKNPEKLRGFKRQVLPMEESGERISLAISNVPASEAIRCIAELSGGSVIFKKGTAYVYPIKGTFDRLQRKEFRMQWIAGAKPGYRDYREELLKMGLVFYEGATARYYPSSGRVLVVNTDDQISILEQMSCIALKAAESPENQP